MGLRARLFRLDDKVLGRGPGDAAGRIRWLRQVRDRGIMTRSGPALVAAATADLADRLDDLERRLASLEDDQRRE